MAEAYFAYTEDSAGGIHSLCVERDEAGYYLDYSFAGPGGEVELLRIFSHSEQITSPALSVAPDGDVLAAWSAVSGGFDAVFVSRGSGGWDAPLKISADKPYPAVLPEFHAGEDGEVYLSWLGYNGEKYVHRSARLEEGIRIAEEFVPAPAGDGLRASENPDRNKYVGFGDSVTAGYTKEIGWGGEGYKNPLQDGLRNLLNPAAYVVLRGVGGERTSAGVNRIDSVLREERAGHILIMEGINDLQARLSYNAILFNLQEMVRKSVEFGSVPVVGVLPPRDDSHAWQSYTREFNDDYLRPYLKREGILMADHWKYFNEQPDWRDYMDPGGQHPNLAGYDLLAEAWLVALEPDAPPSGFTGWKESGCVVLAWEQNSEYGHAGYNVYRSVGQVREFEKLNEELVVEPFFRDCAPPEGYLYYAAAAVDRNGNESDFSDFFVPGDSSGGMCFIATAAFGSPLADEVKILSRLRDDYLLGARLTRRMVSAYYKLGPAGAVLILHPRISALVRIHLKPLVRAARFFLN